jgi:hypothetical protein
MNRNREIGNPLARYCFADNRPLGENLKIIG